MKCYSIPAALFIATLFSAPESIAQQNAATLPRGVNHAEADEPWMYPVEMPASPTINQLNSLIRKNGFVESLGVRIFTSTTTAVPADVARFEDIVKWYSDKLGDTDIPKSLDSFNKSNADATKVRDGVSKSFIAAPTAHTRFRFTPDQKQITIMLSIDGGDTVAVSLIGTKDETSIHVIRHHANNLGG